MVGHGGSSAGSYLTDPTSPIPSHCASIVATSTLRVKSPDINNYECSWPELDFKIFKIAKWPKRTKMTLVGCFSRAYIHNLVKNRWGDSLIWLRVATVLILPSRLQGGRECNLQVLIKPWICAPGANYSKVDKASAECKICPALLHITSHGNQTPDLLILSPLPYPLSHMLVENKYTELGNSYSPAGLEISTRMQLLSNTI